MSNLKAPAIAPAETKAFYEESIVPYFLAWKNKDVDAGLAYFIEESRFDDYHVGFQAKDKAGVRQWLELAFSVLTDIEFDVISISGNRQHFLVECLMSWTWAADYEEYKKGEKAISKGVSSIDINSEGKFTWQRDYYIPLKEHFLKE